MTTIAVRDGIMAADSARTVGNGFVPITNPKVQRVRGVLVGGAGDGAIVQRFIRWFAAGAKGEPPGLIYEDDDGENVSSRVLVLHRDGLRLFHSNGTMRLEAPFFAVGSGAEFALTAMSCGLSAAEAVAKACEFDPWSRPPIQVEELNKRRKR